MAIQKFFPQIIYVSMLRNGLQFHTYVFTYILVLYIFLIIILKIKIFSSINLCFFISFKAQKPLKPLKLEDKYLNLANCNH